MNIITNEQIIKSIRSNDLKQEHNFIKLILNFKINIFIRYNKSIR
jgi:hypothetical protein